jgi:AI-2 transport protein TqsA
MAASLEAKVALAIVAAVAVAFAAYQAASVFAPLVLALFIIGITWPLQRWLQSRMPKLVALAITLIVIVAVGLAFASLVAWGFGRVGRALMSDAARYQALYDNLVAWLDSHGISVAGLWAEHFNVRWLLTKAQYVTGRIYSTLAFWLITLTYVILGLLEVDDVRRKVETLRNRAAARVIIDGSAATAVKFRKYLLVRTQMSVLTGLVVGLFALVTGLQFAAEWGVVAFALNYIPFIGPFIATLFPTLVAMTQFDTWQGVVGTFICLNIIQFAIGSYVEPRLSGSMLSISPFVVLFTIFFWTFLWGLFGHRRADRARASDILRAASVKPMAGRPARRPGASRTDQALVSLQSAGFTPAISTLEPMLRQHDVQRRDLQIADVLLRGILQRS